MVPEIEKMLKFPWQNLEGFMRLWLDEDLGRGDITTESLGLEGCIVDAEVVAKSDGIVCGVPGFQRIMSKMIDDMLIDHTLPDGSEFRAGDSIIRFSGSASGILSAERTALNLLNHLSGISTLTGKFVKKVEGTKARIYDTRKTIPGWRALQKYAVSCGGGENHRVDLSELVMLKDNHLELIGGMIDDEIMRIKGIIGNSVKVEVEVRTVEMALRAANAGADIIMLDNMTPDEGREVVRLLGDKVIIEASGGINLDNVRAWAEAGVDMISIGALTHSAPSADLSLDIRERRDS